MKQHTIAIDNNILSSQTTLRQGAAQAALSYLQNRIQETSIIGIGTGATVETFIQLFAASNLPFAYCVSSSQRSSLALTDAGLKEKPLALCTSVDFYIDGIDEGMMNGVTLKGGGGALSREKVIASIAKTFITIADSKRQVQQLGKFPLPVEILPAAQLAVQQQLVNMGGQPCLRHNVITDNGNLIFDVSGLDFSDPARLETVLNTLPGVVENGVFALRKADLMIFSDGKGVECIAIKNK